MSLFTWLRPRENRDRIVRDLADGRQPHEAVTHIESWDIMHPLDPRSVLPDPEPLFEEISALVAEHAAVGSFDAAFDDLCDRKIAFAAQGWRVRVNQQYEDGLQVHDRIVSQGVQIQVRLATRISQLRDDLARARTEYQAAYHRLTGRTPATATGQSELPDQIELPDPLRHTA